MKTEKDYILGTHREELERLGLQHRVWRPYVLKAWQKAGITEGSNVFDVGAGPGYATADIADIVGERGSVVAIERSSNFIEHLKNKVAADRNNIKIYNLDLMDDPIPESNFDFVWCRWVACFVNSPKKLVKKLADSLKPGGKLIFHEYIHYESWKLLPPNPQQKKFVDIVMKTWRENGGEPNIAAELPQMLHENNIEIIDLEPLIFTCTPKDYFWQWPKSFIKINLERQVELAYLTSKEAEEIAEQFYKASKKPSTLMITPMVLQIIAKKNYKLAM